MKFKTKTDPKINFKTKYGYKHIFKNRMFFLVCALLQICSWHSIQAVENSNLSKTETVSSKSTETIEDSTPAPTPTLNQGPKEFFDNLFYAENKNEFVYRTDGKSKTIWVIFQNDCQACHKMMIESKCLEKNKHIKNYYIGIQSSPGSMVKAVSKYIDKQKILYSKSDLVNQLKVEVTPTVFVFKNSKLVRRIDNYASCRELK